MMLWECCTEYASKFGKLTSGHRTGKGHFSFQCPRKQCQRMLTYHTISFSSHASKVMLKFFQVRLQQYMNLELPDVQAGFRKGRGTRDHLPTWLDHQKSKRISEKHLFLLYGLCQSLWLCGSQQTGKFFKIWEYQTTWPASWDICM